MASKQPAKKKNNTKKQVKKAVKFARKAPILTAVLVVIVVVAVLVIYFADIGGARGKINEILTAVLSSSDEQNASQRTSGIATNGEFSIHFLELGNYYAGDSVLIDCGDVEILIDAGSRDTSAKTIKTYVDQYCTDGVLEYVIATHAHQDHIAGFVGTDTIPGIFDAYECKTIIDFPLTKATSKIYNNYVAKRDAEVAAGAKHYTAAECIQEKNGAKRVYQIAEDITLEILDSYYYYKESGTGENNYSVCTLITNGTQHYLFTGDLEKEGEEKLVEMNELPHCELYKGGHHGSSTSSSNKLLEAITPDTICICCCVGSPEYTENPETMFPTLEALTRMVQYTTDIYCTSLYTGDYNENNTFDSFNGNIVVTVQNGKLVVQGTNNSIPLPKTEWCKINRPTIYVGQ